MTSRDTPLYDTSHAASRAKGVHQLYNNGYQPVGHRKRPGQTPDGRKHKPRPAALINQMPVEILGEIFTQYLRVQTLDLSTELSSLTSGERSLSTPMLLGQVCGHWRNISLSMASLWSSISIYKPKMRHVPIVQLWLERAGNCPLTLYLCHGFRDGKSHRTAGKHIISLLITRIHLWKEIDFHFVGRPYHTLLNLQKGAAKQLEFARLDLNDWDFKSADHLWRVLHASPTLRRADWDHRHQHPFPVHVPWAQLTSITLERAMTPGDVVELLKSCPQLVMLHLYALFPSESVTPMELVPVLHSNLRVLNIVGFTNDCGALLKYLILPRLTRLRINHLHDPSAPLDYIGELLTRSRCRLQKFDFSCMHLDEDTLLHILFSSGLQSITELELASHITDKTVLSLTRHRDLLPNLRAITLSFLKGHTSDGVLSNLVASRLPLLRDFEAGDMPTDHPYSIDLAVMDSFRKQGYNFSVSLDEC